MSTTKILVLVLVQCVAGCTSTKMPLRDVTTVHITEEAFQCDINTACELPVFVLASRQ